MFTFVIFPPVPLRGIRISAPKGSSLTGLASTDKPYQTLHDPQIQSVSGWLQGELGRQHEGGPGVSTNWANRESPSRMLCEIKRLR